MQTTIKSVKTKLRIPRQLRESFAGQSTTGEGSYFPTKGAAIHLFDSELAPYGLRFNENDFVDYNGDDGRACPTICNEYDVVVGCAVLSWHRMPSGRYEFTGYIA